MARKGTKRQAAIEIMTKNSDKPMAEVCKKISEKLDLTNAAARAYYKNIAESGWAPGKYEPAVRAKKDKPSKPAKSKEQVKAEETAKERANRLARERYAAKKAAEKAAQEKTPEEVPA